MADIFISYSRKNEAQVKQLVRVLERMRHTVRYDQDHSGGHVWWDAILADIRASKLFIVALSYPYLDSYPCSLEYDYAETLGKLILPVMVSPVDFGNLPVSISQVNVVQFTKTRDEDQVLDLSGAITDLDQQPIPALPNPLPTPPNAPIPRVSILLEQITDRSAELTSSQQEALSSELLDLYLNPESRQNARFALEKLRERPELRTQYAERIDRLLALSSREIKAMSPQKPPTRQTKTSKIPPSLRPVWLIALAAVVMLVVIVGFIATRGGGALPTATGQPISVAQTATFTLTWTPIPPTPMATITATNAPRAIPPTATPIPPTPTYTPSQASTPDSPASPSTRTDSLGISQVWVPAGCFKMGSDSAKDSESQTNEQPAHDVCITKGYWLDQFDVTNADFDAFVKAGGYSTDAYWSANGLKWKQSNKFIGPDTSCKQYSSDAQQPRVCVSWYEAEAYANWRTKTATDGTVYTLPTEAEWEYAARGVQSPIYPWGNQFDTAQANTIENGVGKTSAVGSYPAGKSWVGIQDMAGNVWQWVADWYDAAYYQTAPKNDPTGPTSGTYRVLRGGSWLNRHNVARAAYRSNGNPVTRFNGVGFRLVGVVPS